MLVALLENPELLFRRAVLFGLNSVDTIAPIAIGLTANVILGVYRFNADLFTLFDYR
jgi:hypothetical protein